MSKDRVIEDDYDNYDCFEDDEDNFLFCTAIRISENVRNLGPPSPVVPFRDRPQGGRLNGLRERGKRRREECGRCGAALLRDHLHAVLRRRPRQDELQPRCPLPVLRGVQCEAF